MTTHVLRVWLPDRPGALGAVASRIGAVRGDLVGIDILERGAGRAIDELVVQLPSDDLVPLLVSEVSEVDGVDVEDVRPLHDTGFDARAHSLETAAALVEQGSVRELLDLLVRHVRQDYDADWVVVVGADGAEAVAQGSEGVAGGGDVPPASWLRAFVVGSGASAQLNAADCGPDDVAWAELPAVGRTLVLGREGRPLRARERRQLLAVARIAGARWRELAAANGHLGPASLSAT
ncbi:MAG: hypothetical protein M3N28_06415 [Actinomycetota bacterium]|nr:hypothetical protein [Actinomycetota bacterium]